MAKRRIILFGATGRVGGRALQDLLSSDAAHALDLVAVTRRAENLAGRPADAARIVEYDLDRAEHEGLDDLKRLLDGADSLLLITGYDQRMLVQSKAVLDAAQAVGVRHVVHIGAHAAPDTTIVHLGWHQMIEAYLELSWLGWTNLRPTSYMQNLPMMRALAAAPTRILQHYIGHAATSWIDAHDVGRAAARVLLDPQAHQERSY
jgi:NAD(P)H dehydrogenase (quinone)